MNGRCRVRGGLCVVDLELKVGVNGRSIVRGECVCVCRRCKFMFAGVCL